MSNEYIENEVNDRLYSSPEDDMSKKRNIEGYEEKFCIELAGKYIILAENQTEENPYLVCNIKYDNMFGMEERYDGIVSDNFIEAMREFITRIDNLLGTLEKERIDSCLPFNRLTNSECIKDSQNADFHDKLLIVKPEILAPEYRSAEHQLVLCVGGFGASVESRGRAVFVKELYSGHECRYNRHQIAGIADTQKIPNWAIDKLLEYNKKDELDKSVEKISKAPKKKSTLQEKLENAKQKVERENAKKESTNKRKKRSWNEVD